jgi:hypothetical protein
MKNYFQVSLMVMLTVVLLLAGCSKPTESSNTQKTSPEAVPSSQPAISAPAENTPRQIPAQPKVKTAPPVAKSPPVPPAPKIQRVTIPAGTLIPIRTIDSVDSRTDQIGQTFRASVDSDITIGNQLVVLKGADARLNLILVSSAGTIRGKSQLQLQLDRIVVGTNSYVVVSNVVERASAAEGPRTARDIAIGAAIGAAVGAITGGKKGAAIGAGVGAGSGGAVAAITKGEQVLVPSETRLEFRLEQPVEIGAQRSLTD